MQSPTTPENNINPKAAPQFGLDKTPSYAEARSKLETVKAKIAPLVAAHKAELAAKPLTKRSGALGIEATLVVPDDFPTIQDAVDAAMPGDKITVKASGSPYAEEVVIITPDLEIVASGAVTLLGIFAIAGADGVSIEGFTIDATVFGAGIVAELSSGGKIKDNTIDGGFSSFAGILLGECAGYVVEDNVCSRNFVGIVSFASVSSNLFKKNRCWENAFGIVMDGSNGNQLIENRGNWNFAVGILLFESNNNELQKNICNNNAGPGFVVEALSSGNIIRPDNSAQKNGDHGIVLTSSTSDNKVKENTFTMNTPCDILDDGTGNVFKNNTFGCKTP